MQLFSCVFRGFPLSLGWRLCFHFRPKTQIVIFFWFLVHVFFMLLFKRNIPFKSFFLSFYSLHFPFKISFFGFLHHHPFLFTPSCFYTSRLFSQIIFQRNAHFSFVDFLVLCSQNVVSTAECDVLGHTIVFSLRCRVFYVREKATNDLQ